MIPLLAALLSAATPSNIGQEELYGATNIVAAVGNGELSAAWSAQGELVVLRWPNPTFDEHLHYKTETGESAWSLPYMGAAENDGGFDGVIIGAEPEIQWLRDPPFLTSVGYADTDIGVVERQHSWGLYGVVCHEFVSVDRPVLRRRCTLTGDEVHSYVGYLNPALMTEHTAFAPSEQSAGDDGRAGQLRWEHGASAFVDVAGTTTLVVGVDPRPEQVHCGRDNDTGPGDAFLAVGGSQATSGPENLSYRVAAKQVETLIVLAGSEEEALLHLEAARAVPFADAMAARELADRQWLTGLDLPDIPEAGWAEFVDRALLSLQSAQDPESGAMAVSVASQPALNVDRARDGAVFDALLSWVADDEALSAHTAFLASMQRTTDGQDAAFAPDLAVAGSWADGYLSDGTPHGFADFGIDQVGWGVWTLAEHAAADQWDAIEAGVAVLLACADDNTGLPCAASEEGKPETGQTLVGAAAVWAGLDAAIRAAEDLGKTTPAQWTDRRTTVEAAIRERWVRDSGLATEHLAAAAALIWPGGFTLTKVAREDAIEQLLAALDITVLHANPAGSTDDGRLALALAWLLPEPTSDTEGDQRAQLSDVLDTLIHDVATDTGHFGGTWIPTGSRWRHHSGTPHRTQASTVALAVLMYRDHPDAGNTPEPEPESEPEPGDVSSTPPPTASSDEGCSAGQSASAPWSLTLLLLGLLAVGRRRPPSLR